MNSKAGTYVKALMQTVCEVDIIWQSWYYGIKVFATKQIERCVIKYD